MIALDIRMPTACTNCPFYEERYNVCILESKPCSEMPVPTEKREDWCPILKVDRMRFSHVLHEEEKGFYTLEYFREEAARQTAKLIASTDDSIVCTYVKDLMPTGNGKDMLPGFTSDIFVVHPRKEKKNG